MSAEHRTVDVAIIGAGPAGAVAAALLRKRGRSVLVLERQHFPRFSIGESLLPQSMAYLEEAGMLQAVVEAGFQYKNGAHFTCRGQSSSFDFRDKHSPGWGTTYQVERAVFDDVLIRCAAAQGAEVRFGHTVRAMQPGDAPVLDVEDEAGAGYRVSAKFVLDASGFGRVLPRLLDLETSSRMPSRAALFTHVKDEMPSGAFDRNKICIATHPDRRDVWFWMIPLAGGRCSAGCVAAADFLEGPEGERDRLLRELIPRGADAQGVDRRFAVPDAGPHIGGYAANVERLHGEGFALLGNAGEFLDPVFSSGVTIALRSAHLAVRALERRLDGENVDWLADYDRPLRKGIDAFRAFVERWYTGELQDIVFYPESDARDTADDQRQCWPVMRGMKPIRMWPIRSGGLNALHAVCMSG